MLFGFVLIISHGFFFVHNFIKLVFSSTSVRRRERIQPGGKVQESVKEGPLHEIHKRCDLFFLTVKRRPNHAVFYVMILAVFTISIVLSVTFVKPLNL